MSQPTPLPIRIQVLIGSIRDGRAADAVSHWTLARAHATCLRADEVGVTRTCRCGLPSAHPYGGNT